MAEAPVIINEENFYKIKALLRELAVATRARAVFLVDRDGQPIADYGEIANMDTTSFSSLAAGNVAATSSMAKLIGENEFPSVVHEGKKDSIFIAVLGRSLLAIVFDEKSTLSLVKIRSKSYSFKIASVLEEIALDSANQTLVETSFFAEVTDDDIDSLFS